MRNLDPLEKKRARATGRSLALLVSSAVLSSSILLAPCDGSHEPLRRPRPRPVSQSDAGPKKGKIAAKAPGDELEKKKARIETMVVKEGHYMLMQNVLWNSATAPLSVFRITGEGVEFMRDEDYTIHRHLRTWLIRYGEKKPAGTFLRDTSIEPQKGTGPGTAILKLEYPQRNWLDHVYEKKEKRMARAGESLFKGVPISDPSSSFSLTLTKMNLWGVELAWDGEKPGKHEPYWIKYGDTKTHGNGLLTVTIVPNLGDKPGATASIEVSYPEIRMPDRSK
jgi:hypothetical protein